MFRTASLRPSIVVLGFALSLLLAVGELRADGNDAGVAAFDAQVGADIAEIEQTPERSKKVKKCLKALSKARVFLARARTTRTGELKLLKKAVAAISPWLEPGVERTTAARSAMDGLRADMTGGTAGIRSLVESIQQQKQAKRLGKFLDRADKRLGQAAEAAAAGRLKKFAARLLQASKQLDKAQTLAADQPGDPPAAPINTVIARRDASDVTQVFVVPFVPGATTAPTPRQVSDATQGTVGVQTGKLDGKTVAIYWQDGDLYVADVDDPDAVPTNLTQDVPTLSTAAFDVSGEGGFAVVKAEVSETMYLIDLRGNGNHDLQRSAGAVTFLAGGRSFILESIVSSPFLGKQLDLFEFANGSVQNTTIAGPSTDGKSAYAPTCSQDGGFLAFLTFTAGEQTARINVTKLAEIDPVEVDEGVTSLGDASHRQVAGAWFGARGGDQGLAYRKNDNTFHSRFVPSAATATFASPVQMDHDEALHCVVGASADDLVVGDAQNRLVHFNWTRGTTVLTNPAAEKPQAVLLPQTGKLLYGNAPAGAPDEIRLLDFATGLDEAVAIPAPNADASAIGIDRLRAQELGGDRGLISFQVEGGIGALNGVWQLLIALSEPLDPTRLTLTKVISEPAGDRLVDYRVSAVEPEDEQFIFGVAAVFRNGGIGPGKVTFEGVRGVDGTLKPFGVLPVLGAEALALPFLAALQ